MNDVYEKYHRIVAQLVAGEPDNGADQPDHLDDTDDEAARAAFIRVLREELGLPGKP